MAYNPFDNGVYNVTPPVLVNGEVSPVQLDVNGNQKTSDVNLVAGTAKAQQVDGAGHVQPAGDVPARSVQVEVTDGTNVIGTSAHPFFGEQVDGSGNVQPAGDVPTRSVNVEVTDGTNVIGTVAHPLITQAAVSTIVAVLNTATATAAGNTTVWTPASGKKFRLQKFQVQLTDSAAMAAGSGDIVVSFQDNTTPFGFAWTVTIPTAALTAPFGVGFDTDWIDIGTGYLSVAANNVLHFNIAGANPLTSGSFRVNVMGTEE